jgi:hypothetical protein
MRIDNMGVDFEAQHLLLIDIEENIESIKKILSKNTINNIKKTYEVSNMDLEISNDLIIEYIQTTYDDGGGLIEIKIDNIEYNISIKKLSEQDMGMKEGYYLSFFLHELYELIPKPLLIALNKFKIEPKEEKWVSWS